MGYGFLVVLVGLLQSVAHGFTLAARGVDAPTRTHLRCTEADPHRSGQLDPSMLPGDPSLVLTTSATLTDKAGFVKAASAAVASVLSKPEAYVAVCVTDAHEAMSFGGTTEPCALGCVYSIGQINQENNGALTAEISQLLEKHGGVPDDRIYLNFFDVPRANCGWSSRTFAG